MFAAPDVFLASARALRFVREQPRDSNAGQAVEAFLATCGLPKGHPWCMAFVHHVGRSCFGALWPLPLSASCAVTLEAAERKGLVVTDPQPGDLVFVWHAALTRHAHVWIVAGRATPKGWPSLEGNTNDGGSRDGWGVFSRVRQIGPKDVVVRWAGAFA